MERILFLDESGDHNLVTIDREYPVFVLGGVVVDRDYAVGELDKRVREFKRAMFGRDDIILHTSDIARQRNGFEALVDRNFRARFFEELNALMRSIDYQVIACAILKEAHRARYGPMAFDPYDFALQVLVERFCFDGGGWIVAEERDTPLNIRLQRAWERVLIDGTGYVSAALVKERVRDLRLRPKSQNIAGLQIADLIASPIGRHVIGKRAKEDWQIVEGKMRRGPAGQIDGFGLVVLPKE
jgi:hypothetical protein